MKVDLILRKIADHIADSDNHITKRLSDSGVAIYCNMNRVLIVNVEMRSYTGYIISIREFDSPMYFKIEISGDVLESLISDRYIVKYIVAIYNDKMALKPLIKGGEAE